MSSTDPFAPGPPAHDRITPGQHDVSPGLPPSGFPPAPPVGLYPHPRPLFWRPHPNGWWGMLWCIGFLFVTQVPGALVAAVILMVAMLAAPQEAAKGAADPTAMMQTPAGATSMAAAFLVTEVLVIGASL